MHEFKDSYLLTIENFVHHTIVGVVIHYVEQLEKKYREVEEFSVIFDRLETLFCDWYTDSPDYHLSVFSPKYNRKSKTRHKDSEFNFGENFNDQLEVIQALNKLKSYITADEYLFLAAWFYLEKSNDSKGLLYIQTALSIEPANPVYYMVCNLILADESFHLNFPYFIIAIDNYPKEITISDKRIHQAFRFIVSFKNVLGAFIEIQVDHFQEFLSFLPKNGVQLYSFIHRLDCLYSPTNILRLLSGALRHNNQERSLLALQALFLYKSGDYSKAYTSMQQADIFSLPLDEDDVLELHVAMADLQLANGDVGKALLEFQSIVQNVCYKDSWSAHYFRACFSLIELHIRYTNYKEAGLVFNEYLWEPDEAYVECYGYDYYRLKGDLYRGMQVWEDALKNYRRAAAVKKTSEILRRIEGMIK